MEFNFIVEINKVNNPPTLWSVSINKKVILITTQESHAISFADEILKKELNKCEAVTKETLIEKSIK